MTHILLISGPYLALYLWAFVFALQLLLMTAWPTLIAPLFNKYDPLPEGDLKAGIEELAGARRARQPRVQGGSEARSSKKPLALTLLDVWLHAGSLRFPLTRLYVVDGSKRSGHSNAYMYGFFRNKRIVLYDTLLKQCSPPQIVAVLAHELGHWKLGHTLCLLAYAQALLLTQFAAFAAVRSSPALFAAFGFREERPALMALLLFSTVMAPIDQLLHWLQNLLSRR